MCYIGLVTWNDTRFNRLNKWRRSMARVANLKQRQEILQTLENTYGKNAVITRGQMIAALGKTGLEYAEIASRIQFILKDNNMKQARNRYALGNVKTAILSIPKVQEIAKSIPPDSVAATFVNEKNTPFKKEFVVPKQNGITQQIILETEGGAKVIVSATSKLD